MSEHKYKVGDIIRYQMTSRPRSWTSRGDLVTERTYCYFLVTSTLPFPRYEGIDLFSCNRKIIQEKTIEANQPCLWLNIDSLPTYEKANYYELKRKQAKALKESETKELQLSKEYSTIDQFRVTVNEENFGACNSYRIEYKDIFPTRNVSMLLTMQVTLLDKNIIDMRDYLNGSTIKITTSNEYGNSIVLVVGTFHISNIAIEMNAHTLCAEYVVTGHLSVKL